MEESQEHEKITGSRFVEVKLNFDVLKETWTICSNKRGFISGRGG